MIKQPNKREYLFYWLILLWYFSVNTKVDLRFHLLSADWIPENVQQKILERVSYKTKVYLRKPHGYQTMLYGTLVTPHYDILTLV